jgi:hypothetical protein
LDAAIEQANRFQSPQRGTLERDPDAKHIPLRVHLDDIGANAGFFQRRCKHNSGDASTDDQNIANF